MNTKILNTIAECLKFKNHHHMKDDTCRNVEQLHQTLVQDVHNIYEKVGISGLFSIIMLFVLQDKTPDTNGKIYFDMTPEELDTYVHAYGISMPKNTLPTAKNIFDSDKKGKFFQ